LDETGLPTGARPVRQQQGRAPTRWLSDGVLLQDPHVGDLLAVPVTGAYCFTMSNTYNGARRIPVVFVAGVAGAEAALGG